LSCAHEPQIHLEEELLSKILRSIELLDGFEMTHDLHPIPDPNHAQAAGDGESC
jgi:hypothetical protein